MKDNTALVASPELRQYIEALVEEVVLEGKPFENHKKYLERFCEAEGIDFPALNGALASLFKAATDFKETGSASSEQQINLLGQRCFLSDSAISELLSSLKKARSKEEAERKKREKEQDELRKQYNLKILNAPPFHEFPCIQKELAEREDFNEYYYKDILEKVHNRCCDLSRLLEDKDVQQSGDYPSYALAVNHFLSQAKNAHWKEIDTIQRTGEELASRGQRLGNSVREEQKEKELKKLKNKRTQIAILTTVIVVVEWYIISWMSNDMGEGFLRDFSFISQVLFVVFVYIPAFLGLFVVPYLWIKVNRTNNNNHA